METEYLECINLLNISKENLENLKKALVATEE